MLIRESVNVAAAGGPAPMQDWKPHDLSPDLSKSMTRETLAAARDAINMAFGVLPGLTGPATTGPMVREAQRHLAQWVLQPVATGIEERQIADLLGQKTRSMARHYSRSANLADRNRITMETPDKENGHRSQVVKPFKKTVKP